MSIQSELDAIARELHFAGYINLESRIKKVSEVVDLVAKSQYNKALEDLKAKLQSISGVQCDVCEGSNWKECGCRIEGQNEGLKAAIEEIEKLKK